jgi:hypothetical protein
MSDDARCRCLDDLPGGRHGPLPPGQSCDPECPTLSDREPLERALAQAALSVGPVVANQVPWVPDDVAAEFNAALAAYAEAVGDGGRSGP